MSPNSNHYLVVLALLVGLGTPLDAQERAPEPLPKVLGRILVLDTERCLEGEVTAAEDQYCVRQGRSEVWIPAKKVLRVCPDWKAALELMRQRANLHDPDERLRLARWCQINHLLEDALVEARAAQEMRPRHADTAHLLKVLKDNVAVSKVKAGTVPRPVEEVDLTPSPDLSPEITAVFATKIQPILNNACMGCHANGKGGAFQLQRTPEGGHRPTMQRNVKLVLTQIRFDRPELSPLLIKAVSPHGSGITAPLPGKKSFPYQVLEHWVRTLIGTHPHLVEKALEGTAAAVPGSMPVIGSGRREDVPVPSEGKGTLPPKIFPPMAVSKESPSKEGPLVVETVPLAEQTPRPSSPAIEAAPVASSAPSIQDPYEADSFNRVAHPER